MHLSKNESNPIGSETCGADRDRTDDIQLAKLALSQLSYSPVKSLYRKLILGAIGWPVAFTTSRLPDFRRGWWA